MDRIRRLLAAYIIGGLLYAGIVTAAAVEPDAVDMGGIPEWHVVSTSLGGKLLFSDSPEFVAEDGIMYQDKVDGFVRLFFYHVNASSKPKKVDVILENKGQEAAQITVGRHGLGGPGQQWMAVGKQALTAYLTGAPAYKLEIPPGQSLSLSSDISEDFLWPNALINGIFDFTANRSVTVKVMMMSLFADSIEFAKSAKVLPYDQYHLRGTFEGANRKLVPYGTYDAERSGVVAITLADNGIDRYLSGTDATDGSRVVNYGNYGVMYQLSLPSKKSGRFACYLVPLGGPYAGAIEIKPENDNWGPVSVPRSSLEFGSRRSHDYCFLGTFDGGDALAFTFSPPGGSNLPVRLVVLPQ